MKNKVPSFLFVYLFQIYETTSDLADLITRPISILI